MLPSPSCLLKLPNVSKETRRANGHDKSCVTVTTEKGWLEVLVRQQDSSQLDTKQRRMETVCTSQSQRNFKADCQRRLGVLFHWTSVREEYLLPS